MNVIDFFIGLTFVNTLPHFVIGIWQGRMLSIFGFSPKANLWYGLLNFAVSMGLYLYEYGLDHLRHNGMMLGGLLVIIGYFAVGRLCYSRLNGKAQ